jgi:adenosylmethionine-8-amino-7-oxononanoate aminotransferase
VERGVLLRPLGDVVVVMPPLTITDAELDRIVDALVESIHDVATSAAPADTVGSSSGRPGL